MISESAVAGEIDGIVAKTASASSEERIKGVLHYLSGRLLANGPSTMFFASTLVPISPAKMDLFSHIHVGNYPKNFEQKWAHHMARGTSPILRKVRSIVNDAVRVGKIHVYARSELCTNNEWFLSRIYTRLARGLKITDQIFSWQQMDGFVFALILRSNDEKSFDTSDKQLLRIAMGCIASHTSKTINPNMLPPYLTLKQEKVRNLVMSGITNKQIALILRNSEGSVEKLVGEVLTKYSVENRQSIVIQFLARGGTADFVTSLKTKPR